MLFSFDPSEVEGLAELVERVRAMNGDLLTLCLKLGTVIESGQLFDIEPRSALRSVEIWRERVEVEASALRSALVEVAEWLEGGEVEPLTM